MLKQALTFQKSKDETNFDFMDILDRQLHISKPKENKLLKLQSSESNDVNNAKNSEITRSTKSKISRQTRPFLNSHNMKSLDITQRDKKSPNISQQRLNITKTHANFFTAKPTHLLESMLGQHEHSRSGQIKYESQIQKARALTTFFSPYQSIWATNLLKEQFNVQLRSKEKLGLCQWVHVLSNKDVTKTQESKLKDSILNRKNYIIQNISFDKMRVQSKLINKNFPNYLYDRQSNPSRNYLDHSDNPHDGTLKRKLLMQDD